MPRGKKKATSTTEPPAKKARVGIDMTKIPLSLRNEGYTSGEEEKTTKPSTQKSEKVSDYLKCPVCKELYINPEMFSCGHTVCKMCIDKNICPVCKGIEMRNPMPNYVLNQLIEEQFPEKKKQRQKELDEILDLRKRVDQYIICSRYAGLSVKFAEFMQEKKVATYSELFEYLKTVSTPEVKGAPSEEELKYFLSLKLSDRSVICAIGENIVYTTDVQTMLTWIENYKNLPSKAKKKRVDMLKMLPLLLMCMNRVPIGPNSYQVYDRLAKLYEIDIGKEIPVDEWKNQPSFWIKGIDMGEVRRLVLEGYRCSCGLHHHNDGPDSDDEDDFYESDSD